MATLTITTTGAQDVRIVAAVKRATGAQVDPGVAEVKAFIIVWLTNFVQDQERQAALAAIAANTPIAPT